MVKKPRARLENESYDIIILDLRMPRIDGEQLIQILNKSDNHIPIIVTTGYCDGGQTKERIKQYNIAHYIEKPIDLNMLEDVIRAIQSKPRKNFLHDPPA